MKDATLVAPGRRTLVAAAAAVGFALAPGAVTPPGAHALPIQGGSKCRPGQIKVVKGTKYVCDIHGKWVKVVKLRANGPRTQATVTTGILR